MARNARLDASSLRRTLAGRKAEPAPVYFLYGEETFQKEEAAGLIRKVVLGEGGAEQSPWNVSLLEGGATTLAEVLDAARTLPMLSERRLVLVRESEKIREQDSGPLRDYLKDPTPTTCLVFHTGAGKIDLRKGVFRALLEHAAAAEFRPLKGAGVGRWIRERARERGAEIDSDAAALLEAHTGSDLFRIDQELIKVLDFLAPSRKITAEALAETLGSPAAGSVFELAERVGAGENGEAIRLLRGILAEGEEPVRLLFLIARQMRILILGKALVRQGRRGNELAQALGIPPYPFVLEKTEKLIARFPESAGPPSLRRILEADRALKGGGGKGPAILERLILDLVSLVGEEGRNKEART